MRTLTLHRSLVAVLTDAQDDHNGDAEREDLRWLHTADAVAMIEPVSSPCCRAFSDSQGTGWLQGRVMPIAAVDQFRSGASRQSLVLIAASGHCATIGPASG